MPSSWPSMTRMHPPTSPRMLLELASQQFCPRTRMDARLLWPAPATLSSLLSETTAPSSKKHWPVCGEQRSLSASCGVAHSHSELIIRHSNLSSKVQPKRSALATAASSCGGLSTWPLWTTLFSMCRAWTLWWPTRCLDCLCLVPNMHCPKSAETSP